MNQTAEQYQKIISICRQLFLAKTNDYGTAWRILRPSSLTDQIFIKANRIRTIQENGLSKVDEGIESEFIGIVNYCIMALVQLKNKENENMNLSVNEVANLYDTEVNIAFNLMQNKNHDYGEAWRNMRISSLTDLILMKILRLKQIEDNSGKTEVSEGPSANYQDMLNYAVFALILLNQTKL